MRWTFSIALILLLFSSCTSSKQLKKMIAPKVNMMLDGKPSRLKSNIIVLLDTSVKVPNSYIETKTLKKWYVPLLIVNFYGIKIKAKINPDVLATRFSWYLCRNAGVENLQGILAGDTLKVIIKSIPTSFLFYEYTTTGFGILNSVYDHTEYKVEQLENEIELLYQWGTIRDTVLGGELKMSFDIAKVNRLSEAEPLYTYFTNWDNSLNQASMVLLRQVLTDYAAKKK